MVFLRVLARHKNAALRKIRWTAETAIGNARLPSHPNEGGLDEIDYAIALWDAQSCRLASRTRRRPYRLALPPSLFRSYFPTKNF
jgi:hypothetical protein